MFAASAVSASSGESGPIIIGADLRGSDGLAAADLGTDGTDELIVGSGFGAVPIVRVLRADGSRIYDFVAFADEERPSVRVAAGDLDDDGIKEIVAVTGAGPASRVRVFDKSGKPRGEGFLPYGSDFRGGLAVTVGDFSGTGSRLIATIPASGGGAHVKILKPSGRLMGEFLAFPTLPVGDYDLAAGDFDGDGKDEMAVMRVEAGRPVVRVMSAVSAAVLKEFPVGVADTTATLSAGDYDGDGRTDILVASGEPARLYAYDADGKSVGESALAGEQEHAPARAVVASFGKDPRMVASSIRGSADARLHSSKFIEVDVSEQRLRAYESGKLVRSTLVATGLKRTPTPIGEFNITAKPYKVHYAWFYGSGAAENYDLGWVTWNLRFQPHIYLHYAPWRSVFGVRGSHGCVNLSKADAEWIYGWADVGTPVTVKE